MGDRAEQPAATVNGLSRELKTDEGAEKLPAARPTARRLARDVGAQGDRNDQS
jgi:hypothetical protein